MALPNNESAPEVGCATSVLVVVPASALLRAFASLLFVVWGETLDVSLVAGNSYALVAVTLGGADTSKSSLCASVAVEAATSSAATLVRNLAPILNPKLRARSLRYMKLSTVIDINMINTCNKK